MIKFKLKEITNVIMGQSPCSSAHNKSKEGLPFMQDKTTFGRIYPYFDTWTTSWNKEANKGDVLFTVRAPIGDVNIANDKIAIGRGLAAISALNCNPNYLFYLLEANKESFTCNSAGTVFDSINKDKLENTELLIHSIEEQQHMVDITRRQINAS